MLPVDVETLIGYHFGLEIVQLSFLDHDILLQTFDDFVLDVGPVPVTFDYSVCVFCIEFVLVYVYVFLSV